MNDTISAAELADLTGLGDRRHRQLAEQGHFPKPVKSQYETIPTLKGLFAYFVSGRYREGDALDAARLRKLETETERIEIQNAKERGEFLPAVEVQRVLERGFCAMVEVIKAASNLEDEDKRALLNRLRETAQAVAAMDKAEKQNQLTGGPS
jgi:hypothetical protein